MRTILKQMAAAFPGMTFGGHGAGARSAGHASPVVARARKTPATPATPATPQPAQPAAARAAAPLIVPPNLVECLKRVRRAKLGPGVQIQADTWGLALSGGGVRSATFCYGLICAMARRGTFLRFDLLSTVSGGGYTGAMVGRVASHQADAAGLQRKLAEPGATARERDWLRLNSRYLLPRGSRDFLFAISTFVRNLAGVHIELGVIGIALGCALGLTDIATWWVLDQLILGTSGAHQAWLLDFWRLASPWPTLWLYLPATLGMALAAAARYWWMDLDDLSAAQADHKRHRVTNSLAKCLQWSVGLLVLGAIDWLAWRLANKPGQLVLLGSSLVMLLTVLRAILPHLSQVANAAASPSFVRIPVMADAAGRFSLLVLALFWTAVVHAVVTRQVWDPVVPAVNFGAGALALALASLLTLGWMGITGRGIEFLNRSSLHHFYRSRLTRTYLGAANAERTAHDAKVTSPHDKDDVPLSGYRPHETGGPVHMLNVCVNQTVQKSGLFNIDRKGELMTLIGPGYYRVERKPWKPLPSARRESLGTWVAVSGAAAAPGLGSGTRPGYAALMTTLGIRLGYWWQRGGPAPHTSAGARWFPKYMQLLSELLARLPGSEASSQYLSDGGHSENTGAYALLVERCKLIVLADCGADPDFRFDDLENLIRRARIDLDADIRFIEPPAGVCTSLGTLDEVVSPDATACIAVAMIDYGNRNGKAERGVMVLVKPNLTSGLPEDVYNYARDHACFPQETTADQFFDEEQWESYYALGCHLGAFLTEPLLKSLAALSVAPVFVPAAPQIPAPVPKASSCGTRRRPVRLGARSATAATIGAGALTAAAAVWTTFESIGFSNDDGAVPSTLVQPLHLAYAAVQLVPSEANNSAVNRAAAEAMMLWRAASADQIARLEENPSVMEMVKSTSLQCGPLYETHATCHAFVDMFECNSARPIPTPLQRNYGYWARSTHTAVTAEPREEPVTRCTLRGPKPLLTRTADLSTPAGAAAEAAASAVVETPPALVPPAAVTATAAAPVALATNDTAPDPGLDAAQAGPAAGAACAPPADGQVCKGMTVNVRLYSGDGRDSARTLRAFWQAAGASVPPFENVSDTARRQGRSAPAPKPQPTVSHNTDPDSVACAHSLAALACQAPGLWKTEPRAAGATSASRAIDVWLPPESVAAGFDQWTRERGVCFQERRRAPVAEAYALYCYPVRAQCEQALRPLVGHVRSACQEVVLSDSTVSLPRRGWDNARYQVQAGPFPARFPQPAAAGAASAAAAAP